MSQKQVFTPSKSLQAQICACLLLEIFQVIYSKIPVRGIIGYFHGHKFTSLFDT